MNKHAAIEEPKLSSLAVRTTKKFFSKLYTHIPILIQEIKILFSVVSGTAYNRHNVFTFTLHLSGGRAGEA
jgi:hypothetical protein